MLSWKQPEEGYYRAYLQLGANSKKEALSIIKEALKRLDLIKLIKIKEIWLEDYDEDISTFVADVRSNNKNALEILVKDNYEDWSDSEIEEMEWFSENNPEI